MKTKKLIELLQKEDPSGELECCIGNCDIFIVYTNPAYYDGTLQVLKRDENNPYYNIIGAKYTTQGQKVVIRELSIRDALFDNAEMPIDYSEVSKDRGERLKAANDQERQKVKEIDYKMELDLFINYIKDRGEKIVPDDLETLKRSAKDFFDEQKFSHDDPFPPTIAKWVKTKMIGGKPYQVHPSYNDKRKEQWDRMIDVGLDGSDWKISRKS